MLKITKETLSGGIPVFQSVFETAQGGFVLDSTGLPEGFTIPAGTPISYDESTRKAKPLITATVYETAGGSATAYKVKKGHAAGFVAGQYVAGSVGGAAYAITTIDTSNANYDVINVGTTLGAIAEGAAIFRSSATGASAGALMVSPRGLLYEDTEAEEGIDLAVVIRGTVYARRTPAVVAEVKALIPNIIYSQSF
ncbi:MAG TPA: hypothetical protein PL085_11570 [Agriterribacter sp.]|uniref:hypothetical protein n=1 Tax=Agriterribacter sp. TaxID=2821509 RepID=UPI002C05CCFE|nr:hypothetical protein [Agriterribacter sp.]HRQ17708.1 hypothetical protein [Agriterribacter sp.]